MMQWLTKKKMKYMPHLVTEWILYNSNYSIDNAKMDLLKFRIIVTTSLLRIDTSSKPKRLGVKVSSLPQEVNLIGGTHVLERTSGEKQIKSKIC